MSTLKNLLTPFAFASLLVLSGCPATESGTAVTDDDMNDYVEEVDGDMHAHTAKFGGELIEVGEHEFSLETVEKDGKLHVYVMDAHHEEPVMVKTGDIELELDLEGGEEVELEGEPVEEKDGMASQFAFAMPEGVTSLEGQQGHFHLTIDGTNYEPHIGHTAEDHDDHEDHEDHDHGDEMKKDVVEPEVVEEAAP